MLRVVCGQGQLVERHELHADALPVVLRQSLRAKAIAAVVGGWWAFMTGCGAFLAAGRGADSGTGARVLGTLILVVATPLALYWLFQLVPGSCRLTIAPDGLHARHAFIGRRLRWEDVDRFYVRRQYIGNGLEWSGVAFVPRVGYRAGIKHLLVTVLRVRGVFRTDVLPDTYGMGAGRLSSFLNECDRRWSGEKASARRPRELPATRGVYVLVGLLLLVLAGFLLLGAFGAAVEGDWGAAIMTAVLGALLVPAIVGLARKWRRPTVRY
jgi:hypothetical protein